MNVENTGLFPEHITDCRRPVANIEYAEGVHAARTIVDRMEKHLSEGAATLCVVGEDMMGREILQECKERKIEDYLISVDLDAPVTEADIKTMKSRIQRMKNQQLGEEFSSPISMGRVDQWVTQWVSMKYGSGPNGQPAIDSLDRYLCSTESAVFQVLLAEYGPHPFRYSQGELAEWCHAVREASTLFRPEWQQFHEHSVFQMLKPNLQNHEHFDQVSHTLFLLSEQASAIRDQYYKYIMDIKTEWIIRFEEKLDVLENRLQDCLEQGYSLEFTAPEIQLGQKTQLTKRLRQIEKDLIASQVIERYAQISDSVLVSRQIESHLEKLQNFRKNLPVLADNAMKSVNLLNQDDGRFSAIESEAQQFIDYINRTDIFASPFEMNTLSLQKQAAYIRHIAATLETTLHTIYQHRGVLGWFGFCQDLEPARLRLIRILSSLEPSDWEKGFEMYYHYCRLSDAYSSVKAMDVAVWETVSAPGLSDSGIWRSVLIDEWNQFSADPTIKTTFLHFLETGNSGEYPIIWSDFLNTFAPVVRILYPVILANHDQFPTWNSTEYEHLVYVDYRKPNVEILQYMKTIYSWFAEGSLAAEPDFLVKLDQSFPVKHIAGLPRSEKLPFLRQVAEKLMDLGIAPVPYSIRNGCVLSFCSPGIDNCLKSSLRDYGLKKVASVPRQDENILATLLDSGGNVYILFEDGLPNGHQAENWRQQRSTLSWLAECGCTLVHICTKKAFYSHGESVRQTLRSTMPKDEEFLTNRPIQLTFAFE